MVDPSKIERSSLPFFTWKVSASRGGLCRFLRPFWPLSTLLVAFFVGVGRGVVLGAPLRGSGWPLLLLVPEFGAASLDVPGLLAVVAVEVRRRCGHGETSTSDPPFGSLARLFVEVDVAHGRLNCIKRKRWVAEHEELDVVVLVGDTLHADVLEAAVSDGFMGFPLGSSPFPWMCSILALITSSVTLL